MPRVARSEASPQPVARGAGTFAQLNTRVDPVLTVLVDEVARNMGWTKRTVIEHALMTAYPDTYRKLTSEKES